MASNIHNLADVQSNMIGEGTNIWQFTVVLSGAKIGDNCNVNSNCFIENEVVIGNNVTIKSGVQVWDGVTIENNVFIGPNVTFTNDLIPRSKVYQGVEKTLIKHHASIGANSTIIAGIEIGEFAFIGAGSVVTKNIAAYTVWYGNPAKHQGYITDEKTILNLKLLDKQNNQYQIVNGKPILK